MNKIHVAHISTVHDSLDNRIYRKECISLYNNGYKVTLIGIQKKGNKPELIDYVPLKRRNRIGSILINTPAAFSKVLKLKPDIIHIHDPELIPMGLLLRIFGYRVVYDMHEDLPAQIYDKNWIPVSIQKSLSRFIEVGEWLLLRFFSGVVTVTIPLSERIRNKNICVLRNYPLKEEFRFTPQNSNLVEPVHRLLYIGMLAFFRGLKEMVDVTLDLATQYNIELILCGEPVTDIESNYLNGINSPAVIYKGWQERDELSVLFKNSHLGLVLLYPTKSHELALPVKLFEYMGAGLPVLCSDFSNWTEIVRNNNCGLVTNPMDTDAIREKVIWMIENKEESRQMGLNGKAAVMEKYLWENEVPKLIALYDTILA